MKNKIFLILPIVLLAAGCGAFSAPPAAGLIKTVNGGADWQYINKLAGNSSASLTALEVSHLGFDPQNRQTIFAGSYNGGLYKSTDAGSSWTNILAKIYVYDFAINPQDSNNIFVAGAYGGNAEIVKTMDGGATWQQIYNEQASGSATAAVRSVALNPADPSQIAAGTETGEVIKSSDGGTSWQLLKSYKERINKILWQNGNLYALAVTQGLFKSTDQGSTFVSLTAGLTKASQSSFLSGGSQLNFSQLAVDTATSSLIYLATDHGLYKTTDAGATWNLQKLPIDNGKSVTKGLAIAPENDNIVFVDVGATIYKTLDGGNTWQTQKVATTGFVNYILVDPQLPQIVYAGIYVPSQ